MISYFTDPLLRAPTIGSMLMALASALIGVITVIRKRSLVGEALAHATYPGVVIGILLSLSAMVGAFISALSGLFLIDRLTKKKVHSDAALCFTLALFFGIGVLLASRVQFTSPLLYQKVQLFLYGQAATLSDGHLWIYSLLCLGTIAFIISMYHVIKGVYFDREFAHTAGIDIALVDLISSVFLILAVVIGMRSVGIVLMSGMLIAPAVAARQWTNKLSKVFFLSALFGIVSALFGVILSVELPSFMGWKVSLPTGPIILLCAISITLFSVLCSPKRGLISRYIRIIRFQMKCRAENILKSLYKGKRAVPGILGWKLKKEGWIEKTEGKHALTSEGKIRAENIIRLHRLWEVYLIDYLGQEAEVAHCNAEEIEHIITPELEKELMGLINA